MLGLHVEAVDVVEPTIPGFGNNRKRPPVAAGVGLAMVYTPLNHRIAHDADAVRVGDHYRAFEEAGLFDPGSAGHFSVAILRKPAGEYGIHHGVLAARKNRRDTRSHRAFADREFAV